MLVSQCCELDTTLNFRVQAFIGNISARIREDVDGDLDLQAGRERGRKNALAKPFRAL